MNESFSSFLADFGVTATVGGVSVKGVFENGFADVFGMDSAKPSLMCTSSDISAAARGTAVMVATISYTVASVEADGTGMTKLMLEKV